MILARKKSSSTAAWNQERFRLLIENSSDVISLIDEKGIITYSSPSISKVLGYVDSERVGHSIFENIHPDDLPRLKKVFTRLIKKPGAIINDLTRYRHSDGRWLWMEGMAKNLLHDPFLRSIVVNFRDVTDRKKNEIELQKVSHDLNERIKELDCINQVTSLLNMTDAPLDELVLQIVNIIPSALRYPEFAAARIELDGKFFCTKKFRKTKWCLAKDIMVNNRSVGRVEICYLKKISKTDETPFLKEECNLINVIALKTGQIIERAIAAKELNRYSQMLATINDLMVFKSIDGHYLAANEQCCRYFNLPHDQIIGRTARDIFKNQEYNNILEGYTSRALRGEVVDAEAWLEYPVMGRRYMHLYYYPFRETDGCITGVVITARDITEHKTAEEALQHERGFSDALLNSLPGVVYCYDDKLKFLRWNDNFEHVLGYTGVQIREMSPLDFFAEPDKEYIASRIKEVFEKGVSDAEADFITKSGERIPYYFTGLRTVISGITSLVGVGVDISARKQAEEKLKRYTEALRTSEAQLSNALRIARAGHWEYDVASDQFIFNDYFYELLQTSAAETGGYTMSSGEFARKFIHPDDIKVVEKEIRMAVESTSLDYTHELEHRFIDARGNTGVMAVRIFIIKDDQGRTVKTYGVNQNITRHKEAEAELRESESKLREAQHMAQIGYWYWDIKTGDCKWSDEVYKIFRQNPATFIPNINSIMELSPWPEDRERDQEVLNRAIASKEQGEFEQWFLRPDGSTGYYFSTFKGIYDEQGNIIAIKGTVQDITERKISEHRLALMDFALNHVQDSVYLINEHARFINVNEQACQETGYSRDELLKMSVMDIDTDYTFEQWQAHWIQLCEKGSLTLETHHRHKTGKIIPVEVSANYFEYQGLAYNMALARDISERKQAEQELIKNQRNMTKAQSIAQLGNWEWNPHESYVTGSDELFRIFGLGYTQDKCPINTFLERIHPDDLESVKQEMEAILIGAKAELNMDYRVVLPDGQTRDVIAQGEAVYNPQHELINIFGIIQDITMQKRAQEALRESEERFRLLADSAPALIWMTDAAGQCIYFNQGWFDFTGKTFEQEQGNGWLDGIHPDDRESFLEIYSDAARSHRAYRTEKRLRHRDNEYHWLLDTGIPRYGADGVFAGYIGTCIDITEIKLAEIAVRESELRFRHVARATSDTIWDWDLKADTVWWNEGMTAQFGYAKNEIEPGSISWVKRIHPEDKERVTKSIHDAIEGTEDTWSDEYRFQRNDGSYAFVLDRGFIVRDEKGHAMRMVGGMTDLSAYKEAQEKILRLNRVYKVLSSINTLIVRIQQKQLLFEEACRVTIEEGQFRLAWIGLVDRAANTVTPLAHYGNNDGYVERVNISLNPETPYGRGPTARAVRGNHPMVCNDIATDSNMKQWREEALKRGYRSSISLPLSSSGEVFGVLNLYAAEQNFFDEEEVKLLVEIAGDISYAYQNIEKEEKLEYIASYDQLTGLANQKLFYEHLNSVLQRAKQNKRKVGLLVCNLRKFRDINNVYGSEAGDSILQETARRLRGLSTDPVNLGRISNDNFVKILHDVRDATSFAYWFETTLFPALNQPFFIKNQEVQLNYYGGVAVYPTDGEDAETLYRNAEAALKKANVSGEQYLFFQPEMTSRIGETLRIQNKLRNALKENQFVLHYQPKIHAVTHTIVGLEALIRWNDPDTGLVPPVEFIPILEETGLILDVGLWAIDKAASDYRHWQNELKALPPRIAVNVSAVQLRQKKFTEQVEKAIRKSGRPITLDIEITESLIMTDIEGTISKLQALRMAGLGVAIDDFGTGYSSLSYIAKLPIDALKIDRSFVSTMTDESHSMTIVSTIISLAHSLNLKVVGEGVETEEQAKYLTLLKCDEMQGYRFSKPQPAEKILEILRSGKAL